MSIYDDLNEIKKKINRRQKLNTDQLRLLYDLDLDSLQKSKREGQSAVLYDEVKKMNATSKDINQIVSKHNQNKPLELNQETLKSVSGITFPKKYVGNIKIDVTSNMTMVKFPSQMTGSIIIKGTNPSDVKFSTISKVTFPKTINGDIIIDDISSLQNITFPKVVNGDLIIKGLNGISCKAKMPKVVNGSYIQEGKWVKYQDDNVENVLYDTFPTPNMVYGDMIVKNSTNKNKTK